MIITFTTKIVCILSFIYLLAGCSDGEIKGHFQNSSFSDFWTMWNGDITSIYTESKKVGIGTDSPRGALEVNSISGTFIPPRMTQAERDNLVSYLEGSIIYNSTTNKLNLYENETWKEISTDSIGVSTCPTGMSIVGLAGKPQSFCISTEEEVGANYLNAITACQAITDVNRGSAHLCNLKEWYSACQAGVMNKATDNWEVVDNPVSNGDILVIGFSSCDSVEESIYTGGVIPPFNNYRCCIK